MRSSVFTELTFWLLVGFSFVLPCVVYAVLHAKRAIARHTVLLLGSMLVAIAAVDIYLLQRLATLAKSTPSLADDAIFVSEISLALYLIPVMFGGIGINVISHVLINHLSEAEKHFQAAQSGKQLSPDK